MAGMIPGGKGYRSTDGSASCEEISRASPCYFCYGRESGTSGKDWRKNGECKAGRLCEYCLGDSIDLSLERKTCQIRGSSSDIEIHQVSIPRPRKGDQRNPHL